MKNKIETYSFIPSERKNCPNILPFPGFIIPLQKNYNYGDK